MKFYDIPQHIQYLKQEVKDLNEEIMALDPDDPDVQFLTGLLEKSENELDQLLDQDVVDQF